MRLRELRPWLTRLVVELAPGVSSFTARFVSDVEMRRLNGAYRDKPRPTDVLSFVGDLVEGDDAFPTPDLPRHLGDVVISVPTARRQAAAHGHPLPTELRVLLLHGVLHCLGYDHETDDGEMESLERDLRQRWIPQPAPAEVAS
ncbi:MAG: rRNA maturation RNase YbeY [Acidobacteriota bacterium]